jgi:hypothetical protein
VGIADDFEAKMAGLTVTGLSGLTNKHGDIMGI